jgi:hypothetical protein
MFARSHADKQLEDSLLTGREMTATLHGQLRGRRAAPPPTHL